MNGLKSIRESRGLSQSALANEAGVNVRVLQHYEQGFRDVNGAKLATLLRLCLALGCRLEEILTDEETLELLARYEDAKGVVKDE